MNKLRHANLQHFVLMGITGSGKSTVACALATRLDATFLEGDELHGNVNIVKMSRGEALTDEDRWPWLKRVAHALHNSDTPVFVSCSCLRRVYRDALRQHSGMPIGFVHLNAARGLLLDRMRKRRGHFMPVSLFESQLQLLEPLQADEQGVVVDTGQTLDQVVDDALAFILAKR